MQNFFYDTPLVAIDLTLLHPNHPRHNFTPYFPPHPLSLQEKKTHRDRVRGSSKHIQRQFCSLLHPNHPATTSHLPLSSTPPNSKELPLTHPPPQMFPATQSSTILEGVNRFHTGDRLSFKKPVRISRTHKRHPIRELFREICRAGDISENVPVPFALEMGEDKKVNFHVRMNDEVSAKAKKVKPRTQWSSLRTSSFESATSKK